MAPDLFSTTIVQSFVVKTAIVDSYLSFINLLSYEIQIQTVENLTDYIF